MKKGEKIKRLDVFGLVTEKVDYVLGEGQYFYETPKTWELWQEQGPPWFIGRFLKSNVLGTIDSEGIYNLG